jgi:hypothetical protein
MRRRSYAAASLPPTALICRRATAEAAAASTVAATQPYPLLHASHSMTLGLILAIRPPPVGSLVLPKKPTPAGRNLPAASASYISAPRLSSTPQPSRQRPHVAAASAAGRAHAPHRPGRSPASIKHHRTHAPLKPLSQPRAPPNLRRCDTRHSSVAQLPARRW